MKNFKYIIILLALSLTFVAFGQDKETRDVRSFSAVRVSEGIHVYLKKGTKESVTVESDDIDLDRVITEVDGSTLKVHLQGYNNRGYDIDVHVTFVELDEISASSAANIYSESTIVADDLELSSSSAADIEIDIDAGDVEISVSSSGDIEVSGTADYLDASASSAGDINGYDLSVKEARIRASSAGSIKISVTEDIDARASSAGSVRYRGNPKKSNTDSSSGGSVKKVG